MSNPQPIAIWPNQDQVISAYYQRDADELIKTGMRLAADTVYITSVKDIRLPYPQISVVPTTRS